MLPLVCQTGRCFGGAHFKLGIAVVDCVQAEQHSDLEYVLFDSRVMASLGQCRTCRQYEPECGSRLFGKARPAAAHAEQCLSQPGPDLDSQGNQHSQSGEDFPRRCWRAQEAYCWVDLCVPSFSAFSWKEMLSSLAPSRTQMLSAWPHDELENGNRPQMVGSPSGPENGHQNAQLGVAKEASRIDTACECDAGLMSHCVIAASEAGVTSAWTQWKWQVAALFSHICDQARICLWFFRPSLTAAKASDLSCLNA